MKRPGHCSLGESLVEETRHKSLIHLVTHPSFISPTNYLLRTCNVLPSAVLVLGNKTMSQKERISAPMNSESNGGNSGYNKMW